MEEVNASTETAFSILDIKVSDQSDEALQQMHDDILEDVERFMGHVGIGHGVHFLACLILEMRDRNMPVSPKLPQPMVPGSVDSIKDGAAALGAALHSQIEMYIHTPKPVSANVAQGPRNRKARRAEETKQKRAARKNRKKHG